VVIAGGGRVSVGGRRWDDDGRPATSHCHSQSLSTQSVAVLHLIMPRAARKIRSAEPLRRSFNAFHFSGNYNHYIGRYEVGTVAADRRYIWHTGPVAAVPDAAMANQLASIPIVV